MMAHICVSVRIKGRVQGVFFRQSTLENARELGVNGWVRNLPNGGVEALFEGEEPAVKKLLTWCKRGPGTARVDEVLSTREKPTGEFADFRIK